MASRNRPPFFTRASSTPQLHLIDQFVRGEIGRRDFLRYGGVLGLAGALSAGAFPLPGFGSATRAQQKEGGTIRVALNTPPGTIDPVTLTGNGSRQLLVQLCEFLCYTQPDLSLAPGLAESWSPNDDASVWTFKLRQGVKFTNGAPFNAKAAATSLNRLADPANGSNALSALQGVMSKDSTRAVDDYTIEITLDAPNGNFPYVISSDNYNCVMLPADYAGDFEKTWAGTGAFRLESYTPKVGATLVRNEDHWGKKAIVDRVEISFFPELQAQILALLAGQVDIIDQVPVTGSQALLNNPELQIMRQRSTAHHQLHMKCDSGPLQDKRVRQALALTLDRKRLVEGLIKGYGEIGNDSLFAPVYPSTDETVQQRDQDIERAKKLMGEAGVPNGFDVTLTTLRYIELPDYAVLLQNFAKRIGINIKLDVMQESAYYGDVKPGTSPWLDSTMGLTGFGPRAVPNNLLQATLQSDGVWNAAQFKNAEYDALLTKYVRTADLKEQKAVAGKIQNIILDETPVIIAYFYDFLVPMRKDLAGLPETPNHLHLQHIYFT
ncbi:ABC transporter substrate-binding protein [Mesorhizobium sp. DCY119]|uniref:ABC transporter substrate-binding protein n=1 Tax=Mesorhizobium sp. DCY119 TaxID=2108445 RepID=UPI000E74BD40|nr:ABC transporter substrate-binding protein [Mesorhizobium sp. DCY119]RJG40486.1 peptide ABC transporter substrate-binding protein [Mesorhizobium sp. DCY119]